MRNLLLTISYDGTNYHGWQIQKNALTVQETFQNALHRVTGEVPNIKGCSRTDSGVHANMYCVSMKLGKDIPCERLIMALNRHLPQDISVINCRKVSDDFHARYSCVGKEYIYKIWNSKVRNPFLSNYAFHYWYNLDEIYLNEAAKNFIGTHDFTSFSTLDLRKQNNMVRTIKWVNVKREGNLVTMTVAADGFLYNMVRIMIGTLIHVSMGKILPSDLSAIIDAKDRAKAGPTAVPYALYLNKVFYEEDDFIDSRNS